VVTARELRLILFCIENQQMTVEELRHLLFDVPDQDSDLIVNFGMFKELESKLKLDCDEQGGC